MRSGLPTDAENFWRAHLEHMRDLVLVAYKSPTTIDVLNETVGEVRSVNNVKRGVRAAAKVV
jgi:hypothetical protein